ncbi:MAG TPA: carbohydrate ABC transporter permease [candidate division WOR-3 bacterium]|uniref:Carbohydrate ABC transporter permease n=1 Tax=candidate division WOR-3 bacterium TaxID=2052148 RepID=A0A7V5LTS8_UNCW3|nr:carbohydrate ABC transporter permease [candidate division WOR-3 bacterium]
MKKFLWYFSVTLLAIIFMFPFVWMLLTALKEPGTALVLSLPKKLTLYNFKKVLFEFGFSRFFLNSLIVALSSATVSTLFASLAAFAFAKKSFFMKEYLFWLFISSMMVPGLLYVIPQFLIVYKLGWINTYWGMIVPHLANVFGLFLITQFMREIPDSLLESARIDGASEFKIWWRIMVPLALPIVATVFLLNFQFHWSNFLWQLIVAQSEKMYTVPVGLAMFKSAHEEAYTLEMAASSVSIVPISLLFIFAQRYFIEGITQGAVKG